MNKYFTTALAFAAAQVCAAPVTVINTSVVVEYQRNKVDLPVQVLQELPTVTFTERNGNREYTYQESRQLVRTPTRNTTNKVTTTTTRYSDKTTKVLIDNTLVQDYLTYTESSKATRTQVGVRDLSKAELEFQTRVTSTAEYKASTGLTQIKAYAAWEQGWTGRGVTVAVVDSGFSTKQTADKPTNMVAGWNFVGNNSNTQDDQGHGTHVTGIIAAPLNGVGVTGLAYNSTILPVKVLDGSGSAPMSQVAQGVQYAVSQRAQVINLSISKNYTYNTEVGSAQFNSEFGQAYLSAVQRGATVVAAAGNLGSQCNTIITGYNTTKLTAVNGYSTNCGFPAALPLVSGYEGLTTSKGGWIAVGAVDSNNQIASYSNRAGATKQWFIVAPGTNINSTLKTGGIGTMTGTSMAAPYVSGAVALLTEKYPNLTGAQVTEILFKTARDLGAPGVDDVYGHGLLDVERAMQPIGQLKLKSTAQPMQPIQVSQALASSLAKAASLTQVSIQDEYARDFKVNALATAQQTQAFGFQNQPLYQLNNLWFSQTPQASVLGYQFTPQLRVLLAQDRAGSYTSVGYAHPFTGFQVGGSVEVGTLKANNQQLVEFSQARLVGASLWAEYRGFQAGTLVPMTPVSGTFRVVETQEVFGVDRTPQPLQFWVKHNYRANKQLSLVSQVTTTQQKPQVNFNAIYNY
jgi:subtilisin family serine protease